LLFAINAMGHMTWEFSVNLKDGPVEKQSIGNVYEDRDPPARLAKLSSISATCPATGRGFIRKDNHQIFLVPAKN
jgi:hypothetical protein